MKYYVIVFLAAILFTQCKKADIVTRAPGDPEFFDYTLDGTDYHFNPVSDTFTVTTQPIYGTSLTSMYISCFRRSAGIPGYIILTSAQAALVPGTYPSAQPCSVSIYNISANSLQITETSFAAAIGEYFEGSFTGSFVDGATTHNISGSFRAKRNYP